MINNNTDDNILKRKDLSEEEKRWILGIRHARQQVREDWSEEKMQRYNIESSIKQYTNCYAYALGAYATVSKLYRPGTVSGFKKHDEDFFEKSEIFIACKKDFEYLSLAYKPIISRDPETLKKFQNVFQFEDNEHMIGVFACEFADDRIHGFHFIRYDPGFGWSHKLGFEKNAMMLDDDLKDVLCKDEYKYVGSFIIQRRTQEDKSSKPWEDDLS